MGNRSSTAAASSSSSSSQEEDGSGLYLTQDLQGQINQDFESHLLQTEWNLYRAQFLQRHQERNINDALREHEMEQQWEDFQQQASVVHAALDERMDGLRSRVVDLEVIVGHDLERLGERFSTNQGGDRTNGGQCCLETRAELSQCLTTLKDGKECQIFAKKLEKCVTDALASS